MIMVQFQHEILWAAARKKGTQGWALSLYPASKQRFIIQTPEGKWPISEMNEMIYENSLMLFV